MRIKLLLFLTTLFFAKITFASNSNNLRDPRWLRLMQKEKHYDKACKSFDRYWKYHYLPTKRNSPPQEDPRRWIVKQFQSPEKAKQKSNDLKVAYKNFKKWRFEMKPFVKANGTIMNKDERLKAWEQANNHQ